MELKDSIEQRRSIRKFTMEEIDLNDLKEMVRRAGLAPSINNQQTWKFIVIKNRDLLNTMAKAVSKNIAEIPSHNSEISKIIKSQVSFYATFFKDAPAVIALIMHPYESYLEKGTKYSHEEINRLRSYPDMQSAGAAIQNILLSAVDLGYGACWINSPLTAREELEKILNIDPAYHLVSFVAVGKAAENASPSNKRPLEDIIEIFE